MTCHPGASPPSALFDAPETIARARRGDPATAAEAARSVDLTGQRRAIVAALVREGQVTADRLEELHPSVRRSSWSSRLAGLRRDGIVTEAGTAEVLHPSGRRRRVLTFRLSLTPAAIDAARAVSARV